MGVRKVASIALLCSLLTTAAAASTLEELEAGLAEARRSYDVEQATGVLAEARVLDAGSGMEERALWLRVRAGLLLAELLRIEYEQTPESERAERRQLGQRIDTAAQEALDLVGDVPESSERYRVQADLLATMIRSDFRATTYRPRMEEATQRALELDPENERAWVSSAKPYVFADPEHGGDLEEAVRILDRALELDPDLEAALLLRALAYERRGDEEAADADWRAALELNPDSRPAQRALEEE